MAFTTTSSTVSSASSAWQSWVYSSGTDYSGSDYSTGSGTWSPYYDTHTTGNSPTANYVWVQWYGRPERVYNNYAPSYTSEYFYTREQKRAQAAQLEINRQWSEILAEEARLEKEHAELTAKQLLLDLIGEEQMALYEKYGRIIVKGREHDYIVPKYGHVLRVEKDKLIEFCIHLKDRSIPDSDNVIALKMMIETSEDEFIKIANNHGSRGKKIDDYPEIRRAA